MTIKDVAAMAGVSTSAVSRYLNGGSLSEAKRKVIQETIEKTGYLPTVAARMMRTGRQQQVGVLVPRIYSDSVTRIVEGINSHIQEKGYGTVLAVTGYEEESEIEYLSFLEKSGASGIILMGTEITEKRIEAYRKCETPLVITGQNIPGFFCVYHDDFYAVEELTRRMLKARGPRFAYIGIEDKDPQTGRARREGMLSAYRKAGFDEDMLLSVSCSSFEPESGYEKMKELLGKYIGEGEAPGIDGVVCATDGIAFGAMRAIYEAGYVPGKDIGIAGVGDSWMGLFFQPPLTTAHYYFRECGEEAAKMLMKLIEAAETGEEIPPRHVCLNYEIIERKSI